MYKVMYLCGWLIFDNGNKSFRNSRKIYLENNSTREDAVALAHIYNNIFYS